MREERKLGSRGRWGRGRHCVRTRKQAKECHRIFICTSVFVCHWHATGNWWKHIGSFRLTWKLHLIVWCMMSRKAKKTKDENLLLKIKKYLCWLCCSQFGFLVGVRIMFCSNHAVNYRQQVPPDWTLSDPLFPPCWNIPISQLVWNHAVDCCTEKKGP